MYTRFTCLVAVVLSCSLGMAKPIDPSVVTTDFPLVAPQRTIHPLALKLLFGNIGDPEPHVVQSVQLGSLARSNDAAVYDVYESDGWYVMRSQSDRSYSFKYKAIGELSSGGIIFLCVEAGGSMVDSQYLVCRIHESNLYLPYQQPRQKGYLLTLSEVWGFDNEEEYNLFKLRHKPSTERD